jgi:hypothetical protein
MLNASELKNRISFEVLQRISKHDFFYNKKNNNFLKRDKDFLNIIHLNQTKWSNHFTIDIYFYIGSNVVENIFNKVLKKDLYDSSMGNGVDIIFNSPDGKKVVHNSMQIVIENELDIDSAIETIYDIYLRLGMKYFEKYNSIEKMEAIFNNAPFDEAIADIGGMFANRCMRGLILSKLCNPSRYNELVAIYDKEILNTNEDYIFEYEKIKKFLSTGEASTGAAPMSLS